MAGSFKAVTIPGIGEVTFPAEMSDADITTAIERDILPQQQQQRAAAPTEEMHEEPSAMDRLAHGAARPVQGAKQALMELGAKAGVTDPADLEKYTAELSDQEKNYQAGRQQAMERETGRAGRGQVQDKVDYMSLLGNAGMVAPTALLSGGTSMGAAALTGAAQGAITGATQPTESGKIGDRLMNTGVNAAVGAVAAPVLKSGTDAIGSLVQKLVGRAKGLVSDASVARIINGSPELANVPPEVRNGLILEAQAQIRKTGTLDANALERKANQIANGLTPTKATVTRSPKDWTQERNLQKLAQSPDQQLSQTGEQLTSVYQGNDNALTARLAELQSNLPKGTQEAHGMTAMQSLDDLATASQRDVGLLYEQVRKTTGDNLASDARQLYSTLDDLKDNAYAVKLVDSVTARLKRFGMVDKDGNLTNNTLTVNQAEELRKFVNTLPNDFGKRDIIKAIDADVLGGAGTDAMGGARAAARDRFSMLDNPTTQKALNTMGELQQGKSAQNFIKSQIIDAPEQDVKTLLSTIGGIKDKAEQKTAIDALRAGVMQHLEDKALNINTGKFSGSALNKAMDQIGEGKLRAVLGDDLFRKLSSLRKAAVDTTVEPAYAAVNHSNTAPMMLSLMDKSKAVVGYDLPFGLNESGRTMVQRSGARGQLAEALAAKPGGELPELPPGWKAIAAAMAKGGAIPPTALLNERRKPSH